MSLRSNRRWVHAVAVSGICGWAGATAAGPLEAQAARLTVDGRASLAWWQINPHLGHLWATTCPQEPSWIPGSGTSISRASHDAAQVQKRRRHSAVLDTIVPLYPRTAVHAVCGGGVEGEFVVEDLASLHGVRGTVAIRGEALQTGLRMRDNFAHKTVLHTDRYPEIRFRVDSLTRVQPGEVTQALALGVLELHGVEKPMSVPVTISRDARGLRVQGQLQIDARDMIETFGMSKWALGLGVGTNIWKYVHMGVDAVLRPGGSAQAGSTP